MLKNMVLVEVRLTISHSIKVYTTDSLWMKLHRKKIRQTSSIYTKGGALICVSEKENEVIVEHRHEIVSLQTGNREATANKLMIRDQNKSENS